MNRYRKAILKEAMEARDAMRGNLAKLGVQAWDVQAGDSQDGRAEVVIRLSPKTGHRLADVLDVNSIRSAPMPGMVVWADQELCVAKIAAVEDDWVTLHKLDGGIRILTTVRALRPALLPEIVNAMRRAHRRG